MKQHSIIIPLLSALLLSCGGLRKEKVDLIIHNATIYQVDEAFSTAEAMAVAGDSIVAIGAEREILNRYQAHKQIDARKQFVYPGFIDAHAHFTGYAKGLGRLNLVGTRSWQECLNKAKAFKEDNPNLTWLVGRGWDQNDWKNKDFPHKTSLDMLFPDIPVLLTRIDGHAAIANSKALELAGVTVNTKPVGGDLLIDENGLTGVLIDHAVDLVSDHIEPLSDEELKKVYAKAQSDCFSYGVTSFVDAGLKKEDIAFLEKLYADSLLSIRQYIMLADHQPTLEYYFKTGHVKSPHLHIRSVKTYVDGALGSRGAALLEPYSDKPQTSGLLLFSPSHFDSLARACDDADFQLNAHCIGDSANRLMLQIYGDVLGGVNDKRWRIEHAQIVHPNDVPLYGKYTIIPSMQPTHATSDMYWAEDRLGKRIGYAYPTKDLLNQNGIIALGTDFPVEGIDPLMTFYAAVFRQDSEGYPDGGFLPQQKLSPKEALKGMTIHAALAQFEEDEKGSLETGKLADIVILNKDILSASPEDFHTIKVTSTFLAGKQVYEAH